MMLAVIYKAYGCSILPIIYLWDEPFNPFYDGVLGFWGVIVTRLPYREGKVVFRRYNKAFWLLSDVMPSIVW